MFCSPARTTGRSQIASAIFNELADPAKAHSISAGLEPAARVQAEVIEVMREVGLDLCHIEPIALTGTMLTELDFSRHARLPGAVPHDPALAPAGLAYR